MCFWDIQEALVKKVLDTGVKLKREYRLEIEIREFTWYLNLPYSIQNSFPGICLNTFQVTEKSLPKLYSFILILPFGQIEYVFYLLGLREFEENWNHLSSHLAIHLRSSVQQKSLRWIPQSSPCPSLRLPLLLQTLKQTQNTLNTHILLPLRSKYLELSKYGMFSQLLFLFSCYCLEKWFLIPPHVKLQLYGRG